MRRVPRMLKVRLGERKEGTRQDGTKFEYPTEVDYFVLKKDDGATDAVLAAYGEHSKRLLCMLPVEAQAVDPSSNRELVLAQLNRAYGAGHGLKCAGDGGSKDDPGWAETDDAAWAKRITEVVGGEVEPVKRGRFRIACLGYDCPKYLLMDEGTGNRATLAAGHDGKNAPGGAAACTSATVLRCFLLHPEATVEGNEHFGEVLTTMEVATGSWNALVDLNSGFDLMAGFAGRTAGVPFWLVRHVVTTFRGARSKHWPLAIEPSPKIWQLYGQVPERQVFLGRHLRAELAALRQADVDFDSVKDLLPASWHPLALPPGPELPADAAEVPQDTTQQQPANDAAEAAGAAQDDAEEARTLTEAERLTVKLLFGKPVVASNPRGDWSEGTADRLRAAVAEADAALGTTTSKVAELQKRHYDWLVAKYRQHDDFMDEPEAAPAQQGKLT